MKLERLHLKAFGAFSDRTLDLSRGKEGLHLVHGPNEAGKSTTLRAITQLLYGIETRTSDDFLHRMTDLRIGATLSHGKDSLAFYRRKGNKATLLADDEKTTLPDDALVPFLGGVDAESFKNLFGLTHDQLVAGGLGLVQGEGDVGQALFSAAAGMGPVRALLTALENDAGDLFKPTGSKPRINQALSLLATSRKAVKAAQLPSRAWETLDMERSKAEERRAELDGLLQEARAEQTRLTRMAEALPLVSRRATLRAQLAPLAEAVLLPPDFSERRLNAQHAALNARETRALATQTVVNLQEERDRLTVNEAVLAQEDAIEELHQRHSVNKKAMADVERDLSPRLQRIQDEAERTLQHVRPHWTLDQAEALRLPPGQKQRLTELDRRVEACRKDLEHATTALDALRRTRDSAAAERTQQGSSVDTARVERALKSARPAVEAEQALRQERARVESLAGSITPGIARLGLWTGSMEALESLPVPSVATIEIHRTALSDAERDRLDAVRVGAELDASLQQAEEALVRYQREHDAPDPEAVEELRAQRRRGWGFARAAWESGTTPDALQEPAVRDYVAQIGEQHANIKNLADAVATLMEAADGASDRLRHEADRVAQRAQLEATLATLREKRIAHDALQKTCEACLAQRGAEWRDAWQPANIAPLSPVEMLGWINARAELLQDIRALRERTQHAEALEAQIAASRKVLDECLQAQGVDSPSEEGAFFAIVDHAELWVERQREFAQQRLHHEKTLEKLDRIDLPVAEAAVARAQDEDDAARAAWGELMEQLGARPEASATEAIALVEAIDEILTKHAEAQALQQRIDFILRDDTEFRAAVRNLAAATQWEVTADEYATVPALYQALKLNRESNTERTRIVTRLHEEEERLRGAEAALTRAESELAQCCAEAHVDSPAALPEAEKASTERQQRDEALRETEGRLIALSPGLELDALLDMTAEVDPDALGPALEALGAQIQDLDDERLALQESIGEIKTKLAQMDGGSQAADAAEESQALMAAIAEDAEIYARLRVASFALTRAIEHYRAANQEPLLARTGEIFQTLTLGSFADLRADFDDRDRHVLRGVRAESQALVDVTGMSEGTADQLYLALRIASLERHLERHAPIPFVLDDVLVNFDDARAAAALDVLGALSDRTQVIYFTHHAHLVELAKATVGKKRLFVHGI